MKTHRVDFRGGVNVVLDKAAYAGGTMGQNGQHGRGFVTVMDNADLRSGSPRPFRAPSYVKTASSTSTKQIFEYRGTFYESSAYRSYKTELVGGQQRIYYSEYGNKPQKIVNGTSAVLGTPRPLTPPAVTRSTSLLPNGLATTLTAGTGSLLSGDRYYRVAAITEDGIAPPSEAVKVSIPTVTTSVLVPFHGYVPTESSIGASVTITWNKVAEAKKYAIFAGWSADADQQFKIAEVPFGILSFTDAGQYTEAGAPASDYLPNAEYAYIYTYVRDVNGMQDESGVSYPSQFFSSQTGRTVTRDFLNDGYFSQTGAVTISSGLTVANTAATSSSITLSTVTYDPILGHLAFTTSAPHGITEVKKLVFLGFSDPLWANQTYEVTPDSSNTSKFYVEGITTYPTDAPTGGALPASRTCLVMATKITLSPAPSTAVATNDAVYVVFSSTGDSSKTGLYKATNLSSTQFTIPVYTTGSPTVSSIQYVPGNGYCRYWNVYRIGDGEERLLVKQADIWDGYITDAVPATALGGQPDSYYEENGITVDYDTPPLGLTSLESHYGMLFGIDGHDVRWTPIGRPDAWPGDFSVTLPFKPLALASYNQALVILCQDAIYRLDGNQPTAMSLSKTAAEDGCIAPNSVQKTSNGLLYLSKRGVMSFNGSQGVCLTDTRVPSRMLTGPSALATDIQFWWIPTLFTYNYANLCEKDGIKATLTNAYPLERTLTIDGPINEIRSFYHLGKYFIYWVGTANYEGNTALCIDLQAEGMPITTLGMKALDVYVNDLEEAYMLFDYATTYSTNSQNPTDPNGSAVSSTPMSPNFLSYIGLANSAYVHTSINPVTWKFGSVNTSTPIGVGTHRFTVETVFNSPLNSLYPPLPIYAMGFFDDATSQPLPVSLVSISTITSTIPYAGSYNAGDQSYVYTFDVTVTSATAYVDVVTWGYGQYGVGIDKTVAKVLAVS